MARNIKKIVHTELTIEGGGTVLVLNTDATITPEATAMLQALHSRSIGGIKSHLEVLTEKGSDKFMSSYYVGYGHKSIGDCGTATVFVEGISMLASKAIQDWRLYAGQESSTRYIDFAQQAYMNPLDTKEGEEIQESWRQFYIDGLKELDPVLKKRYPIQKDEKESVYNKAISARGFDIMRAFLPAGATTNVAWHMNLRQFSDALMLLRHHPLTEVQTIAHTVEDALLTAYPNSFSKKRYPDTEKYNKEIMKTYYYTDASCPDFELSINNIEDSLLEEYTDLLKTRPPKTELPKSIAECGTLQFKFLLDYGSYRDLQRHRALVQRMPLLTPLHGFNKWYLDELPEDLKTKAKSLIAKQEQKIKKLKATKEDSQYYLTMGYNVANRLMGDLHALTYFVEIRGTRFAHYTIRERAIQIAQLLQKEYKKYGLVFHLDPEPDRFDTKRGEQDIVKK